MTSRTLDSILTDMSELPVFIGIEVNSPNCRSILGDYPLHIAVVQDDIEAVGLLIANGATVNSSGEHGYTPLHEAVEQGHHKIARLLVDSGADVNVKNNDGVSALGFAMDVADTSMQEIVASSGN